MRGVLFDFAGTLCMPRPAGEMVAAAGPEGDESLARSYERAGLPGGPYPAAVPPELADAYAERDRGPAEHERAYVGLLRTAGEPAPGFAERVYRQIRTAKGWVPYADARATIDALLEKGIAVGVVSNVGFDLRPILRAHRLGSLATACALSFEVGVSKPHPAIFMEALRLLGTRPEETLMVGDHPDADGGGAAIGMPTLILPMTPPGSHHGLEAVLRAATPRRRRTR